MATDQTAAHVRGAVCAVPLLLLQVLLAAHLAPAAGEEERLIGWRGEAGYLQEQGSNSSLHTHKDIGLEPWIETIAWAPRAFVYHNFMTHAECDHLVDIGQKRVSRSMVVDAKTGGSKLDDIRTSFGAAFGRGEDPVIAAVEERIAEWTHVPPENGEPIQVLRYMNGQKYDAHWDWFDDPVHQKQYLVNGNRYATVLMYLADVVEGGETTLPLANAIDEDAQTLENPSACAARMGIAVKPRKGDALLFFDMDIMGAKGDRKALHSSCPTLKGTKWTATKWLHNKAYGGSYNALEQAAKCRDTGSDCASQVGQCDDDPDLTGISGTCRKTCEDCVVCSSSDLLCLRSNMKGRRRRATPTQTSGEHPGAR